ncbi:MAG TPA: SUMF1/EgtB/PvdO family nonheme iron enzyme, partial [Myxococcota bacterium]|nr:SUMF1/EgtB/PvdO family nonheme iron enzyme [Myxococcota bacterium]
RPDGVTCGPQCPATGMSMFEAMELANRLSDLHGLERCHLLENCRFVDLPWPNPSRPDTRTWMCASATFVGPQCSGYRLPSAREAELAIRAGSPFCFARGPLEVPSETCEPRDPKSYAQQHVTFCGNARSTSEACPLECSQNGPDPGACWPPQDLEPDETLCLSPQDVRARLPNDFGLYGAYGNVLEWVLSGVDDGPLETPTTIETAPEFVDTIKWTPDDGQPYQVALVSGVYFMPLDRMCGSHVSPLSVSDVVSMKTQIVGFRLVRTVPASTAP